MRCIGSKLFVLAVLLMAVGCASGQSFIGKWVNTGNARDRLHIERDGQAIVIHQYDYKREVRSMPAEYSQGALYATQVIRISFRLESKTGLLISDLGNFRRMTPTLEKQLNGQIDAQIRAEEERQRKAREEEERRRKSAQYKAKLQAVSYQVQDCVRIADRETFERLTKDYPELIGFPGGNKGNRQWIEQALYSDKIPENLKLEFMRFLRAKGCGFKTNSEGGTLLHDVVSNMFRRGTDDMRSKATLLLDTGVDINAIDQNGGMEGRGITALDIAENYGQTTLTGPDRAAWYSIMKSDEEATPAAKGMAELLRARGGKRSGELRSKPSSASDFGLERNFAKQDFHLKDYSGKVLVVAFVGSEPSLFDSEKPWEGLSRAAKDYGSLGLVVVGVTGTAFESSFWLHEVPLFLDKNLEFHDHAHASHSGITLVAFDRKGQIVQSEHDPSFEKEALITFLQKAGLWKKL